MATRARWACTLGLAKLQEGMAGAGGNFLATVFMVTMALLFGFAAAPSTARAACVGGSPNGFVQAGEECDDNDADDHDFCLSDCTLARCGDSVKCTRADCSLSPNLDGTEACDEGGETATCDANCTAVSCGDGDLNTTAGEQCDDGGLVPGDGCTGNGDGLPNCHIETCGDGVKNNSGQEQCDDGNTSNNDSCLNTCVAATCGDGFTCNASGGGCTTGPTGGKEKCDDGGESENCNADCSIATCGDSKVNATAGEECDDGDLSNGDYCLNTCLYASCGDSRKCTAGDCGQSPNLDGPEDCDEGGETATCDANCTAVSCGDGDLNTSAGEECDDGGLVPGDGCTGSGDGLPNCHIEKCGDGVTNNSGQEECDDGNTSNNDSCLNTCEAATCGDGYECSAGGGECTTGPTGGKEQCDDGNASNNDSCLNDCSDAECGDNYVCSDEETCTTGPDGGAEECDDANLNNADACTQECALAQCGDGVVQPDFDEECDEGDATCSGGANPGAVCKVQDDCEGTCPSNSDSPGAPCQLSTSQLVCGHVPGDGSGKGCGQGDGTAIGTCSGSNRDDVADACRTNCLEAYCGDGQKDSGENCDDGNTDNSDRCVITDFGGVASLDPETPNCRWASCGDGQTCSASTCDSGQGGDPEECDDGADNSNTEPDTCRASTAGDSPGKCMNPICGDGVVDSNEECDEGSGNSDTTPDACREDCTLPSCGDGVIDAASPYDEDCDDGPDNGDNKPCTSECKDAVCGDSLLCDDPSCTSGPGGGAEGCDDGKPYVCDGGGTVPEGTPCTVSSECGGGTCTTEDDGCASNCRLEKCGNGFPEGDEECDDGNNLSGDGCDSACVKEECGNGKLQLAAGEACDDGNTTSNDGCSSDCTVVEYCGDGTPDILPPASEECDDGSSNSDTDPDACRTNCKDAHCGDGVTDTPENCDDGGVATEDCNADCTFPACGDSIFNSEAEECDDTADGGTNTTDPDSCRPDCTLPVCGDTVTDSATDTNGAGGEQCDGGGGCTDHCCNIGAGGYDAGLAGTGCEMDTLDPTCDFDACRRTRGLQRAVVRMQKRLVRAQELADLAQATDNSRKLDRAERFARSIRRTAQRLADRADRTCPENPICVHDGFTQLAEILVEAEANLARNKP